MSNVGCSIYTREKWARLEYLLSIHVRICKGIMSRNDWVSGAYHYFDFYAGPGAYNESHSTLLAGEIGSTIRALDIFDREQVEHRSFFTEHDTDTYTNLVETIAARQPHPCPWVREMSCEEAIDKLCSDWHLLSNSDHKVPFGLAFFDPNGVPDWPSLKRFARSKRFQRIDHLININSAICKWVFTSRLHKETKRPTEHLRELDKKKIYLWEPTPGDSHQFALAYCTNGPFPEFRDWGFHLIDSPQGQRIARRIDFSPKERLELSNKTGFLRGFDDDDDNDRASAS